MYIVKMVLSFIDLLLRRKVVAAVLNYGVDQWYSIGLQMLFSDSQIKASTFDLPSPESKLQAIIVRKIYECGVHKTEELLLTACKSVPRPIIGIVLEYIGSDSGEGGYGWVYTPDGIRLLALSVY